ncbi:hypothetical protein ES702_06303 [subsurface metagenome]
MEIKEHTPYANDLQKVLDKYLTILAITFGFTWKTPPHDLARRIMNHIHEFKPSNEGG